MNHKRKYILRVIVVIMSFVIINVPTQLESYRVRQRKVQVVRVPLLTVQHRLWITKHKNPRLILLKKVQNLLLQVVIKFQW